MSTLSSSLPVPSVQALAASLDGESDIPARYIRPQAEANPVADEADVEIPIIDLERARLSQEESSKIGLACEEWGFFQLINHGVPDELMERMKAEIGEFFRLPLEEKENFAPVPGSFDGYGQIFVMSEEQKLDWGDMLTLLARPTSLRRMGVWPTNPPTFKNQRICFSFSFGKHFPKEKNKFIDKEGGPDDGEREDEQKTRHEWKRPRRQKNGRMRFETSLEEVRIKCAEGDSNGLECGSNGKSTASRC